MTSRPLSMAILACAGWSAASGALALGFGRLPESTAFGQPLNLVVPLRLEAGETLTAACVRAEVQLGAQRLPGHAVQVALEPRADERGALQLRLRSAQVVQEPLVAVKLLLGCGPSVSRQFAVLADPLVAEAAAAAPDAARAPARVERTAAVPTGLQRTALGVAAEGSRTRRDDPAMLLQAATRTVAAQDAVLASLTQAASAAEAAAAAAELRLAAMHAALQTARDEAESQRTALQQLRERLAHGNGQARLQRLLAAAVAALALLAAWLGWRVVRLQRARRAPQPGAARLDEATPSQTVPAVIAPAPAAAMPLPLAVEDAPPAAASVDALIDLEQQAEFFLVLGEEQAAVELLMAQLEAGGAGSPMPYLKLLEIFRRCGDAPAYERLRRRFGERFDAAAPSWDADPASGRTLLEHPQVLAALQAAWPRPADALAALEKLLWREPGSELLGLPAYRDLLMLYAVARELHRPPDRAGAEVDLLLPLADGDAATTSIFDPLHTAATASR